MKKIELHLHLDGSLNINLVNNLLGKNVTNKLISSNDSSLKEYLEKFSMPIEILQSYENIRLFSYSLAKELVKEEVIYAEVRFCPLFHTKNTDVDNVIKAIVEGFSMVKGIKINLIFCMMRNFSFEDNLKIIELAKKYLANGVCGIDLAGDEASYKTSSFEKLFNIAQSYNIPYTVHAGEADSYESVDSAIKFGAKRIGHGINSINNINTIKKLIDNNVTLEICPKSNLDTHAVDCIENHPIKKLYDAGVKITINTDNRTVSNTSLEYEYQLLRDTFNFTDDDFLKFNLNAIDAAFIPEEEKNELRKQLIN